MCAYGSEGEREVIHFDQERNGLTGGAEIKMPVILRQLFPSALIPKEPRQSHRPLAAAADSVVIRVRK